MIERGAILWLGIASGMSGGLIGGLLLGTGVVVVLSGVAWGWLLISASLPLSILPGWIMAYRMSRRV